MTTILFFNLPAHGHVNPTLPLVSRLVDRGDRVLYYCTEEFRAKIEATGALFRPYPALLGEHDTTESRILHVADMLWRITDDILPDLLAEIEAEQPDIIFHDSLAPWGWAAAKATGTPAVCSNTTFAFSQRALMGISGGPGVVAGILRGGWRPLLGLSLRQRAIAHRYGLPRPSVLDSFINRSDLNLVYTARAFQPMGHTFTDDYRFVGPSIPASQPVGDFPMGRLADGPVVYISLGTLRNDRLDFYRACLAGLADAPYTVVLSVGRTVNLADLGDIPDNIIVRPFVPQIEILKRADLFLTHAGMNSANEGLYFGVPLLCFPQTEEQGMVARQVVNVGAGAMMGEGDVTPAAIRAKVDGLLADPACRTSAQAMRTALRDAGGVDGALAAIDAFLEKERGYGRDAYIVPSPVFLEVPVAWQRFWSRSEDWATGRLLRPNRPISQSPNLKPIIQVESSPDLTRLGPGHRRK